MCGKDLSSPWTVAGRAATMAVVAGLCLASGGALAGFITEQNLTPIYSANPPFDSMGTPSRNPITVNWLAPTITIFRGDLTNITAETQLNELFALPGRVVTGYFDNGPTQQLTLPTSPTVDVFFVDSLSNCFGPVPNLIGCVSGIPGISFVVNSSFASGGSGAALEAHELGHDLGLVHCPTNCPAMVGDAFPDLMNPVILGNTTLTTAQADMIVGNASGLVQMDASGNLFINLQAIAVVAEPSTFGIVGIGVVLLLILLYPKSRARALA